MTPQARLISTLLGLSLIALVLSGCGSSDDNRQPTPEEIKKADVNRQKLIDNLNVPEDQKVQMRAHMGGPPAPNPADAAKAGNTDQKGRRR